VGGEVVGAIGVSGAPTVQHDVDCAKAALAGAGRLLCAGGLLVLYGPFMRDGLHNAPSNAAFDASLKARNPSWGMRDIADLERVGEASRLGLRETIKMPGNNMSVVFSNGTA
jgi:hypothetical protein